MSQKIKPSIVEEIAPNLIPLVDIMFLLLLFFILGTDMGHRQLEDVKRTRSPRHRPSARS